MGIANIIEWAQGITWPDFLQPHVEVLLLWITWAVDYIDLDYLERVSKYVGRIGFIARMVFLLSYLLALPFVRFTTNSLKEMWLNNFKPITTGNTSSEICFQYLLWLFLPIIVVFVLPVILVVFIYGCIIFLHVYGLRNQIQEAYHTSYWNGARVAIASFWDAVGSVWHGYELRGIENVPDEGSALFIYYHGCLPLDVYYLISKLVIHKNRSLHCVGDKFIFKIPGWKPLCKVFSITAGTVDECTEELKEGNLLCIAPGGVREALFSDPHIYDIQWGKRLGFARVVINSRCPVIPMFTENCRESFRTPEWGRNFFRWIYEKTKIPLCPIYGGFPVKMITHLGKPMTFNYDNTTPEEVRRLIKREVRNLIREHQRLPGSVIRGIMQRFHDPRKSQETGRTVEEIELLPTSEGLSSSQIPHTNGDLAEETLSGPSEADDTMYVQP